MDPKKEKTKFKLFGSKETIKDRRTTRKLTEMPPVQASADDLSKLSEAEIEKRFVLMLEDMNLSKEQTEALRNRPLAVKIEMLASHQHNIMASKNNDPEAFIAILRNPSNHSHKQLLHMFDELNVRLRTSGVSWIRNFNNEQNDGLNLLLKFMAFTLSGYNSDCGLPCLRCIRMLGNCGYGLSALVDHETASTFIARCLDPNQVPLMECAIELLSSMALCDSKGYQKVMDGLTYSAELANAPGDRFVPLVRALGSTELARSALQLINVLVNRGCVSDSSFDVDYRIHLRMEFNQLGIEEKISKLANSPDEVIGNHISIYHTKAEEDIETLLDRFDAAKCDFDDASEVFQLLNRTITGTTSEKKFLSLLQHLLFVRDEPYRLSYFTLLDELVGQIVLQVDGIDPDPRSALLRLDVESTISAVLQRLESGGTGVGGGGRTSDLQNKLDEALKAKLEAEATIHTLKKELEAATGGAPPPPGSEASNIPPPPPGPGEAIPPPPPPPPMIPGGGAIPPPPPPMIGGGGIPPPPPPIGGGGIPPPPAPVVPQLPFGMKPKKTYSVAVPMKKANWDRVTPENLSEDSIWVKLKEDELESSELFESLTSQFSTKPAKVIKVDSGQDGSAGGGGTMKKAKAVRYLDGKVAQNLSILLGSLKVPHEELRRRIIILDETLLTSHMVEQLLRALPEPSVISTIAAAKDEFDQLADPEQFVYLVGQIKGLIPRLTNILFKMRFDEKMEELKPDIVDADEALREIHSSKPLRRILELVLLLGNYMNSGSRNAQSLGFQVSFLTKLDSTKDVSNQFTLLHFIVNYFRKSFPELAKAFVDDFSHLEKACRFSEDVTRSSIAEMKKNLSSIKQELENYKPQEKDDAYADIMTKFVQSASSRMTQLETMFERMKEKFTAVARYFAFDPTKYNMESLFNDMKAFHSSYVNALSDIEKRETLMERQRKAAEEQERRTREREERARRGPEAIKRPQEDESNVIDNLMEALKTGAAFGDGTRSGPRRARNRPPQMEAGNPLKIGRERTRQLPVATARS